MRTTVLSAGAVLALLLGASTTGAVTEDLLGDGIDAPPGLNQWIVGFYVLPADREQYMGFPVVEVNEELRFFVVETTTPDLLQAKARQDDNVRYIETNLSDHKLQFTPNDYFVNHATNWGMNKIGLPTAWDRTLGATSVKDGHIDSGIFRTHEDFTPTSRFLTGWNYYKNNNNPNDESGCSWHGSHTTGTVAATINNGKGFPGTAQITILPVKIFGGGACLSASTSRIASALQYVGDQGSHLSSNSWGGGSYSTTINNAITSSVNKGVIFVASAGNGGCSNCIGNPWVTQEANVIIVTATDSNDAGASFNSKGPQTDIAAPGVYIGSAGGPNVNSYWIMDGTSMAAPYVTGVAGLIKTLNPTFTRAQVESRLKSTAVDLGTPGEDDTFGAGRVNAAAAVY